MTSSRTTHGVFFEEVVLHLQLSHGFQQPIPLLLSLTLICMLLVRPLKQLIGFLEQLPFPPCDT